MNIELYAVFCKELSQIFAIYDLDNDGRIAYTEVPAILKAIGMSQSADECIPTAATGRHPTSSAGNGIRNSVAGKAVHYTLAGNIAAVMPARSKILQPRPSKVARVIP